MSQPIALQRLAWLVAIASIASPVLAAEPTAKTPRKLSEQEKEALIKEADATLAAFTTGNADALIQRTSKLILKIMPSRGQFEQLTRSAIKDMREKGFKFESHKHGEPTVCYSSASGDVCFLPRDSILKYGEKRVKSITYFICVHEDGAWKFLDSATVHKKPELLWQLIPDLPKDIELPPYSMEVIP